VRNRIKNEFEIFQEFFCFPDCCFIEGISFSSARRSFYFIDEGFDDQASKAMANQRKWATADTATSPVSYTKSTHENVSQSKLSW
jgi:hypothetical protein